MRVMALDIGQARIGIAISDPDESVASPLTVLPAAEVEGCTRSFKRLIDDWEPELFLCGLPVTMGGAIGPQARSIRQTADKITEATGIPHEFVDERLSSAQAKRSLREKGMHESEMKGKVDMIAASLFLQAWLDGRRS